MTLKINWRLLVVVFSSIKGTIFRISYNVNVMHIISLIRSNFPVRVSNSSLVDDSHPISVLIPYAFKG